jgi:hypothetical protein
MSISQYRFINVAVFMTLVIYLFAPFTVLAGSGNVVLWNKLGSNAEIKNSEVGPGFNRINYL